ncbi:MAG TPA: A/G-specific adenine glycosylase [Steroidobacteraceae bacterium]|nr:A/G-specific adenine glycosylase [Steroidobacteraceae bacterium]
MNTRAKGIASRLLAWHSKKGRHDLPWQKDRSAYRVWVSEIMLQQTQVTTVIPYFDRFMRRFPDVRALANATVDEVMHLWTGLGYYARARNLHRAAQVIRDEHRGIFPTGLDAVMALPGIGRSTAGAILAISAGSRHPILDGNVKRVLARYYAVDGAPEEKATLETLWRLADDNTPAKNVAVYTQAIMDLGATLCTRGKPRCDDCPIAIDCRARIEGRQGELPAAKRKRGARRQKHAVMLVARRATEVLLVQRPPSGIWGGLWCLPEFDRRDEAELYAATTLASAKLARAPMPDIAHSFTHFDLVITPVVAKCHGETRVHDGTALWYDLTRPARVGLPAPIKALLGTLLERSES